MLHVYYVYESANVYVWRVMHVCLYAVCMYAWMCMYVYVWMYVCMYVCMQVCMYVTVVYVSMNLCACIRAHNDILDEQLR